MHWGFMILERMTPGIVVQLTSPHPTSNRFLQYYDIQAANMNHPYEGSHLVLACGNRFDTSLHLSLSKFATR